MSKYFFKDFKYVLNNIKDTRYFYECRDSTHCIGYNFTANDDLMTILTIIEKMRSNRMLTLLEPDDYHWEGSSIIFKDKNHAAIFYIYIE